VGILMSHQEQARSKLQKAVLLAIQAMSNLKNKYNTNCVIDILGVRSIDDVINVASNGRGTIDYYSAGRRHRDETNSIDSLKHRKRTVTTDWLYTIHFAKVSHLYHILIVKIKPFFQLCNSYITCRRS